MKGRPLPDDFGIDTRVLDFFRGDPGIVIGGHVTNTVAAGLDRVHFDAGQIGQQIRHVIQLGPVELDVLPRGEMAVAAVVCPGDLCQHAHLRGRQCAVGDGDPQHIGVELAIQPVHQAQRFELVFGQRAAEAPGHLAAKLVDPFADQRVIEFVVTIHGSFSLPDVG